MHLPPSPVREADLDLRSRASPSLRPWEDPKGRVAPGLLVQVSVALPCSSSLSTGILDATAGLSDRGGGREIGKTEQCSPPRTWCVRVGERHRNNSPTSQYGAHIALPLFS